MPAIYKYEGDLDPIILPIVGHLTTAADAAKYLWHGLEKAAVKHGGEAEILQQSITGRAEWGVRWIEGPPQWATSYVVSEGVTAPEFTCYAEDGHTVYFSDNH